MPLETINLAGRDAQGGEKFTPTPEELRTIQEKMKDPKFVELLQNYMKSMEDPETRREEEAYLQQVERQAKEGGDYSFDFVFPKPGFVVELLEPSTSYRMTHPSMKAKDKKRQQHAPRVYVNMCGSEKIDPFSEQSTGDRMKSNWLVPVSVSKPRTELFSEDVAAVGVAGGKGPQENGEGANPVVVYDAVFHPNTLLLADRSERFCCFLVNIAVEHINSGYGDSHGFEFRRLSSRIQSVGTPQNQTISREKGKSPFAAAMNEPVLTHPTKVLPPLTSTGDKGKTAPCGNGKETSGAPAATKNVRESGDKVEEEHLPRFTIAHQGHIDLSDTWGWKIVDRRVGVPEALVVKLEFAGVQSAADLNIEIESAYVIIAKSSSHPYHGAVTLPFSVESTPLEAKFERRKSLLTLVLRVVPPAPTGITAEHMRQELLAAGDLPDSVTRETNDMAADQRNDASAHEAATAGSADNEGTSTVIGSLPEEARQPAVGLPTETPLVPQVSCIGDQDRVRIMMEKVQAARLERENAAAAAEKREARVEKTGCASQEKEHDKNPAKESFEDSEHVSQREAVTEPAAPEAPAAPTSDYMPAEVLVTAGVDGAAHVEDDTKPAEDATGMELLRQRQDAWQKEMHRRIEAKDNEDREKALVADREARREAERLRRRAEAAKLQEAAAAKLGERMAELPLRNRHIFAVD